MRVSCQMGSTAIAAVAIPMSAGRALAPTQIADDLKPKSDKSPGRHARGHEEPVDVGADVQREQHHAGSAAAKEHDFADPAPERRQQTCAEQRDADWRQVQDEPPPELRHALSDEVRPAKGKELVGVAVTRA